MTLNRLDMLTAYDKHRHCVHTRLEYLFEMSSDLIQIPEPEKPSEICARLSTPSHTLVSVGRNRVLNRV